MAMSIKRLQNKLDRESIDQLREEVARLHEVNENLNAECERLQYWLYSANQHVQFYEDLCTEMNDQIGLTKSGDLVRISGDR